MLGPVMIENDDAMAPANDMAGELDDYGRSQSQMVVRHVMQGLFDGHFAPGQRLIEADLTKRYGVSRGSVREALNRLAAEGIVAIQRHRGAHIRAVGHDEAVENLQLLEMLVGLSARLAAEHIGQDGAADRVRSALERVQRFEATSIASEYRAARLGFFDLLDDLAGNRNLTKLRLNLSLCMVSAPTGKVSMSAASQHGDFNRIAQAVLAGNAEKAERMARQHIRRILDALSRVTANEWAMAGNPVLANLLARA
jgi:DNA-binding GntR family transcriptional regulator